MDEVEVVEESHEQARQELMERLVVMKWGLLPDAGTMRRLEYTSNGRKARHGLQTGIIYEQSFRDLSSLYADVLRFAQLAIGSGPIPAPPEPTWLLSRAGACCGELLKYCEELIFEREQTKRTDAPVKTVGRKGKRIDARMLKLVADKQESHSWTACAWALHLGCSDGTVKGTKTWKGPLKKLKIEAALVSSERMDAERTHPQGRRKPKPKNS